MKPFFAILFLMIVVCVACEVRPTSSQTAQNNPSVSGPSPTQTTDTPISDTAPCSLNLDQAPVINGLRLGMTPEQVLALFPGSSEDTEVRARLSRPLSQFGELGFAIRPDKYQSQEKFAGINQINFTLVDGRVSNLRAGYNGPAWPHVDESVAKFIEGTNLPGAGDWEAQIGLDTQMKTLKCKDFEIQIFAGGKGGILNYISLSDLVAAKKVKEREDKAAEKVAP